MVAARVDRARARASVERWRADPALFAREVLGVDPWEDEPGFDSQASILRNIPRGRDHAVRSGHKTGKSMIGGVLAWWGFCLHPGATAIITAPTGRQVEEVVWVEVVKIYESCRRRGIDLGGRVYEQPSKGVRGSQGRRIFGFSAENADAFSGPSAPWAIFIVDEAAGVANEINEAIEGARAGGAIKVAMGNPTSTSGHFFDAFHELSDVYATYHLNSERSPVVRGVRDIPGVARPEYIERMRRLYRPHQTNPTYAVRVRGDFPAQGSHAVVGLALVDAGRARWTSTPPDREAANRLEVGLDCARFGDDANALAPRRGRWIGEVRTESGMDSIQVAGWAKRTILGLRTHAEVSGLAKKPRVKVDVIGIGAGVYDQLRAISRGELEVVPVNSAEAAHGGEDEERYVNVRAQMHFAGAEWIADEGMLPPDAELRAELLAPTYDFDGRGKHRVEPKDAIKERLGRSPDKADAVHLAIFNPRTFGPRPLHLPQL